MNSLDIADELWRELADTSIGVSSIRYWLQQNVGALNNALSKTYSLGSITYEITPEMGLEEKDIFKKMYMVHYYDVQIRTFLGAAGTEVVIEVDSDGGRVKKVNKTELSKTYILARKDMKKDLEDSIKAYKSSKVTPVQVAGNDTIAEGEI